MKGTTSYRLLRAPAVFLPRAALVAARAGRTTRFAAAGLAADFAVAGLDRVAGLALVAFLTALTGRAGLLVRVRGSGFAGLAATFRGVAVPAFVPPAFAAAVRAARTSCNAGSANIRTRSNPSMAGR